VTVAGDHAVIAARRLNNNSTPAARSTNIAAFQAACNALLDQPVDPDGKVGVADAPREMRWFLISGTFLGLIRENGFLAHDYDIDLGVFDDDIDIPTAIAAINASDQFVLKKYDYPYRSVHPLP